MHFTAPEIARLMGVNVSTIKRWIDKGILPAEKTSGGHRRVSKENIRTFVESHDRVANRSYIMKQLSSSVTEPTFEEYYELLLSRHYQEANQVLHRAYLGGMGVIDILEHIIAPTLTLVGEGWRKGVLSIESEHRMSFVIRQHIIGLEQFVPTSKSDKKPRVLLSCVPGDNHELALHMLSLALRSLGCETEVLGINISIEELKRGVEGYQPDYIALSKVYSAKKTTKEYRECLLAILKSQKAKLLFGGSGWSTPEVEQLLAGGKGVQHVGHLSDLKKLFKK